MQRCSTGFKVKDVDIATGGTLIALLNEHDADQFDLSSGDRILVRAGKRETICILDISENHSNLKDGQIGLFEEVLDKLRIKHKDSVEVCLTGKPESVKHIRKKLLGGKLEYKEFFHIVKDITEDRLTDVEKTYFVSACFTKGLSMEETVGLTKAIVNAGDKLKFRGVTLDKHCIGGVPGNRTTMIVIPLIAAAGFTIPKTSSRAITSPAGTADTMECLAKVELPEGKIKHVVKKTGACIVHGGSMNLAPADDKLIKVRHPLSLDPLGMMLASVMGKKYSVSANHVLIDIPKGPMTKVKTIKEALKLKKMFTVLGKKLGMNVRVIITDGSHPIGNGIGPVLEAEDVMAVLRNDPLAPIDLREKALEMAAELLVMAGKSHRKAWKEVQDILTSGRAYIKMKEIIKAQGKQKKIPLGEYRYQVKTRKVGKVKGIDNVVIAKAARIAGAPKDKGAGLFLSKKIHDRISKGDLLYTIYAENSFKLELAKDYVKKRNGYLI